MQSAFFLIKATSERPKRTLVVTLGLSRLAIHARELHSLDLRGCVRLTEALLPSLQRLQLVRYL